MEFSAIKTILLNNVFYAYTPVCYFQLLSIWIHYFCMSFITWMSHRRWCLLSSILPTGSSSITTFIIAPCFRHVRHAHIHLLFIIYFIILCRRKRFYYINKWKKYIFFIPILLNRFSYNLISNKTLFTKCMQNLYVN